MVFAPFRRLTSKQRRTFAACFFGWTLDAFDFFILTWCLDSVAATFHVSAVTVTHSLFWTLCMRPVGALLFGALAERFGRKHVLMVNIACFTIFGLSSAFAPNFTFFLVTRALFGIGMGGEWGVGAALAFETLPSEGRGFFSGLLQEGYSTGNLLAGALYGITYGLIFPHFHNAAFTNWRALFVLGTIPSLFVLWLLSGCAESPSWLATRNAVKEKAADAVPMLRQILTYLPNFLLLVCMMTAFMSFSHGTQDLYPTFLKHDIGFSKTTATWVNTAGGFGAIFGGICFGTISEKFGRRKAIVCAALLAIPMIPLWAGLHGFPRTAVILAVGGFLMQFMVQGAWGVIPVHLNELSPAPVRAIFPGLAYQIGNLTTSWNAPLQTSLAASLYAGHLAPVLGWTVLLVAIAVALLTGFGREAKGADMSMTI
ncbi:MFS transporter [Granulicella paludicola]|uniref:MFS transporter n=1 Tax=Granulicella paludicola TaxID=474951 RepID=UPI0021E037CC|nr:MFS transporter [Granulicella paludicola]